MIWEYISFIEIGFNMLIYNWYIYFQVILTNPNLGIKWWEYADDEIFIGGVKAN